MNAHVPTAKIVHRSPQTVSSQSDLTDILARQRAAFLRDGTPTLAARMADLAKLKKAVRAHLPEFAKTLDADFEGRSAKETAILEGMALVQGINYLRRNLKAWMRPQKRHVEMHFLPGRSRVVYQPLGVVGIMSPWNFPIGLSLMPLATAIAAGNRADDQAVGDDARDDGSAGRGCWREIFPEEQVAVVTGGADVGAAFSGLPFDHLVFTGSHAGRQGGDEGRQRQPRSGHARARRQVARRRREGLLARARRVEHRLRQARQRRTDLRRARLRARPGE